MITPIWKGKISITAWKSYDTYYNTEDRQIILCDGAFRNDSVILLILQIRIKLNVYNISI